MEAQSGIGFFLIHGAVQVEFHPVGSVHKLEAQVGRHQLGGEIFAPADQFIPGNGFGIQPLLQFQQLRFQLQGQPQLIPDIQVAGGNQIKNGAAIHTIFHMGVAQVQQVRQLVVTAETLACGRYNDDFALRVCHQDIPHLAVLTGIGHGGAAEFDNFHAFLFLSYNGVIPKSPPGRRRDFLYTSCESGKR